MAADIALLHMEMAVQLAADIALLHMVMAVQLASALLLVADHTSPSHKLALVVAVASAQRPELGLVSEQELVSVQCAQLGLALELERFASLARGHELAPAQELGPVLEPLVALVLEQGNPASPELGRAQELVESAQLGLEQGQAQGKESVAGPVVQQAQDTGLEQVCPQSLAQQLFGLRM